MDEWGLGAVSGPYQFWIKTEERHSVNSQAYEIFVAFDTSLRMGANHTKTLTVCNINMK